MRTSFYRDVVSEEKQDQSHATSIKGATRENIKSEMESMINILMPKLVSHDDTLDNGMSFEEKVKGILNNPNISVDDKREVLNLYKKREEYKKFNKLEFFKPYEFQKKFYKASKDYRFRLLMAGNRKPTRFPKPIN